MLTSPMDVLNQFPVRKTKQQKQAFRDAVTAYAESMGYETTVERRSLNCQNLIIGDPEQAKFLVTAHYDTCARMVVPNFITPCHVGIYLVYQILLVLGMILISVGMGSLVGLIWKGASGIAGILVCFGLLALLIFGPANPNNANDNTSGVVTLLEIARTMPENQRHKVCFVLFDQEELGLIGSGFHRSQHRRETERQIVLNLDCVGEGDQLLMFPTKKLKKDVRKKSSLYIACGYYGKKSLTLYEKGISFYPSDQMQFPYGVGICALKKHKKLLYLSRIHTINDTALDMTNVNFLRAALTNYICRDEVN